MGRQKHPHGQMDLLGMYTLCPASWESRTIVRYKRATHGGLKMDRCTPIYTDEAGAQSSPILSLSLGLCRLAVCGQHNADPNKHTML